MNLPADKSRYEAKELAAGDKCVFMVRAKTRLGWGQGETKSILLAPQIGQRSFLHFKNCYRICNKQILFINYVYYNFIPDVL